ncbi:hypothetical protein ACFSSB_15755 [Lacinutrix gracilariae]|uniref:Uncharacterized protein n=1 Tax=Lacinutrix gracilariae TaxID=1747198 RepID=A0ABW5K4L6_9FLAO
MYDTTKIVKLINILPKEAVARVKEPFCWNNCLWLPRFNKYGEVTTYESNIVNLKLWLRGSELTICNSLQKFYMQNNYKAFSYCQVQEAISKLNDYFDFDLYSAEVKKTAVGVVIGEQEDNTFKNWLEYKGNKPILMRNSTRIYGAHFKGTNYNIKGYDKKYQTKAESNTKLSESLIRFELEANSRHFNNRKHPIGIYTVADLVNKSKFDALADELLNIYDTIKKQPIINYQELKPKEILLLGAMKDKDSFNGLKRHHKHSYKLLRKDYSKLLDSIADIELENSIRSKVLEQINYCKNN